MRSEMRLTHAQADAKCLRYSRGGTPRTLTKADRICSSSEKPQASAIVIRSAKHVGDNGRIIYIGSSTTAFPLLGHALGGSKIAPQFLVEILPTEIGHRGVAVNSILPTAIGGAGVYGDGVKAEFREFITSFRPMQHMGTPDDVANVAEYLAGDLVAFVSGQHLLVTGGASA
jgi:3-oxoacyl-[acyl-carrier protein] reductase